MKGGTIEYRVKQSLYTIAADESVTIFAPLWVKDALKKLSKPLASAVFQIAGTNKIWKLGDEITLIDLLAIARNEFKNTTGIINFSLYKGLSNETIVALRDLVKHCVIVGTDTTLSYGGFPDGFPIYPSKQEVYICDLPGLQFQKENNTGRHVLVSAENFGLGSLDQEIYENTVGEKKPSYAQALKDDCNRFLNAIYLGKPAFFDTKAFQAFVAQDFLLAALGLNTQALLNQDKINFKFLKYGTGFFAEGLVGEAKLHLSEQLALGVEHGIKQLLRLPSVEFSQIQQIELPFYYEKNNKALENCLQRIAAVCDKHHIQFSYAQSDALKPSSGCKIATTNCSDPHAVMGNEMQYKSVDAAIAENLTRKGNNFSPICNPKIQYQYIEINHLTNAHSQQTNLPKTVVPILQSFKNTTEGSKKYKVDCDSLRKVSNTQTYFPKLA